MVLTLSGAILSKMAVALPDGRAVALKSWSETVYGAWGETPTRTRSVSMARMASTRSRSSARAPSACAGSGPKTSR